MIYNTVNKFKEQMKDTLDEAKAALAKSKDEMAKYYNQKRVLLWITPYFFSFFLFAFDSTPSDSVIIFSHFTPSSSDYLYAFPFPYVSYI